MKLIDPKNLPKKWVKATSISYGDCKILIYSDGRGYVQCKPLDRPHHTVYMGIYNDLKSPLSFPHLFFYGHGHSYRDMLEFILKEVNDNDSL